MSSDRAVQPHGAGWGWNNDLLGREGSRDGPSGSGRPSNSWGGGGGNTSYGSTWSGAQRSGSDTSNHGQAHNENGNNGSRQCTSWGWSSSFTTGQKLPDAQSSSLTGQAQLGVQGSTLTTGQAQIGVQGSTLTTGQEQQGVQISSTSTYVQYQEGG